MPAPKTTLSSLQGIEDRLRRLYGTAGSFGVEWSPNISLSVDAGDLTGIGCNLYRGRRWSWSSALQTLGAAGIQGISFQVPTIVDRVWCNGTNAVQWSVEVRGAGDGGLLATNLRGAVFTELFSPSIQSDFAPMYLSGLVAASGSGTTLLAVPTQAAMQRVEVEWFMPGQLADMTPGNLHQLVFRTSGATATAFSWGCSGRLF